MAPPSAKPIYDIQQSWKENLDHGPAFSDPLPERQQIMEERWVSFLGFRIASPLGVPAGPLLDSRWTTLAARLGFDIVTYKTIRTTASMGHPAPNVLHIECNKALQLGDDDPLKAAPGAPADIDLDHLAITNSFGMPSMEASYLLEDIPKAKQGLGPGQLLVVSVTGTPNRPDGVSFQEDFQQAALLALSAGAEVVEANYSCPNVGAGQGMLYLDVDLVYSLTSALVGVLGQVPLIIKVGAFPTYDLLKDVLVAASRAGARAVAGINGLSRQVINHDQQPALGPGRLTSGICGAPIREVALQFVQMCRRVVQEESLDLQIVGMGGVTCAGHVEEFLKAGADVVQSATGMMWNPYLAREFHQLWGHTGQT